MKIDYDNPAIIVLMLIIIGAGIWFVGTQYEICLEMPEQWFEGFVSGLITFFCTWLLLHQRE